MTKLRVFATLCAVLLTVSMATAQSNISLAFTGFGFDFGKGENVRIYKRSISDGKKNPVFEPGLRFAAEVYASPATSIKLAQTFRYDVMERMSISTQLMLRFRVFRVYKHSVSLGVGPTAFYRRSWSNIDGYVDEGIYEEGSWQHKIAWLSTEVEYNYIIGRFTDISFAMTHMQPKGLGFALGIKYWFTRKSNKCGTCPSFK